MNGGKTHRLVDWLGGVWDVSLEKAQRALRSWRRDSPRDIWFLRRRKLLAVNTIATSLDNRRRHGYLRTNVVDLRVAWYKWGLNYRVYSDPHTGFVYKRFIIRRFYYALLFLQLVNKAGINTVVLWYSIVNWWWFHKKIIEVNINDKPTTRFTPQKCPTTKHHS